MAEEVKDGTVVEGAPAPTGEQAASQEVKPSAPPEFDASKVDPNDADALMRLTDEQIEKVQKFQAGTPPPEKPPATDTATDTGESKPASDPAEKPAGSVTTYAGKYTSTDDLLKGVGEIGRKVGADDVAMQVVIEAAKKSGDFSSVETLYKLYESRLGAMPAAEGGTAAAPETDTVAVDIAELQRDPETSAQLNELTMTQLAQSNLAQRMAEKGLALPKNMAEFESLTEVAPFFAMQFQQAYQEVFRANLEDAKGYIEAERSLESSNARVIDNDTKSIQDFAKEQGFKLSDAEVAAVKTAALANPYNYETRYGHKFLREGALRDQFMISAMPSKLAEIKIAKEAEGRVQAVNDLKAIQKKEVTSIGTSRLTTKTRAAQKMPDLTDPDVLASLPEAALNDPEGYFKSFTK